MQGIASLFYKDKWVNIWPANIILHTGVIPQTHILRYCISVVILAFLLDPFLRWHGKRGSDID